MDTPNCLSCGHPTTVLCKLDTDELNEVWFRETGVNTSFEGDILHQLECDNCGLVQYFPMGDAIGTPSFYDELTTKNREYIFPVYKEEFRLIGELIGENEKVLDVGCGSGALASHLRSSVSYVGIDYSIESCNMGTLGVDLRCETLRDHSTYNIEAYTSVVLSQVLEHVENPMAFLWEALSVLKPGGHLYIAVPNGDSYLKYLTNGALNLPPHHVTMWNEKSLDVLAGVAGLTKTFVYEEPLQDVHEQDYVEAFLYSFGFLRKTPALSSSWYSKTVKKYARYFKWLVPSSLVLGHSITIEYRKTK